MKIFEAVAASEGLQPFALAKIAIALSVRAGALTEKDFQTNAEGLELNRQTIFGEHEAVFKAVFVLEKRIHLDDEEFFPKLTKAHLDRGAKLLQNEVRYGMHFYSNLLNLEKNI